MINKLRQILSLTIFCSLLFLHSCQTEELHSEDLHTEELKKMSIQKVNLDNLPFVKKDIQNQKKKNNLNRSNGINYLNLINPNNVVVVTDSINQKSYTFSLCLEEENAMTNLIVQEKSDSLVYYVLTYKSPDIHQWKSDINNKKISLIKPVIEFNYLKTEAKNNNRFDSCTYTSTSWVCPSGMHDQDSMVLCDYPSESFEPITKTTTGPCNFPVSTPIGSSSPNTGGGSASNSENPCSKLKDLFNVSKSNIKPIITSLHQAIPNMGSGETGEAFKKTAAGVYLSETMPQTPNNTVGMISCGDYYSGVHTHPLDTYPMFSFSDIFNLYKLNSCAAPHNSGMASFLLACIDDNGVPQTYAIVFDPLSLSNFEDFLINPENIGCSEQEIKDEMDRRLGDEYAKDSNYERVFLRMIANTNVSLYRANSSLTSWSKLTLSNNTPNASVNSTNCN